jgi:large subunit ribosomal protein L18
MNNLELKAKRYTQRKNRVRSRVIGTNERPRLSVFRSNSHIYAQVIDDSKMVTLVSFSDLLLKKGEKMTKVDASTKVGEEIAKKALAKKIKLVTFDRNGFRFHGRVKAVAEGARKGGLEF